MSIIFGSFEWFFVNEEKNINVALNIIYKMVCEIQSTKRFQNLQFCVLCFLGGSQKNLYDNKGRKAVIQLILKSSRNNAYYA